MSLASFAFTKLIVRDLEAMARYYAEAYGLTETQRLRAVIAGSPIEEIFLAADGERSGLILLTWANGDTPDTGNLILGFTTSDIDGLFARATAAGGTIVEPPRTREEAGGLKVGFLRDPEGQLTEVVEFT